MNASRILVAVVFLAAAGVAGYLVFTGKRAQLEPGPALDAAAHAIADARRDGGVVTGTLDGRAVEYRNYASRQTTYTDVRVQLGDAPAFESIDGLSLSAELRGRIDRFKPFAITCDGHELRVQADRILQTADEATTIVGIARDLARGLARK